MINIQKIIFMVRNIVKNIVEKATKILVVNAGRISTTELVDKIYNFCEVYSGKVMYAYQAQFSKRIIRSVLENDGVELTALFSRQSGKCFAKDTEILMYDGRREKVQDIREGDLVMTPNSSFAEVVSLGRGTEEMYEVKPLEKNHESFVVNKSHILSLMGENNEVKNISVEDYLKLLEWERRKYRGYRVGVEYKHKSVPLDPYLLGINIGLVNIKPDEERRIPKCYLINNRRKRLKLLAGLIDSNVCIECNEDSNILTFNNKELAKDVLVLIRSLGYKSNIAEKIMENNEVIYNVKSYGDFSYIFNAEDIECNEGGIVKFDFELIPKGVGEYYGFTLDSKDRLFLLGDYTVTHNTETVAITVGGLMIILPQLANMPMFLEDPRFRMFRDGFQVGIFAPSQRQAQITYGRMKSRLQCKEALVVLEDPDFNLVFTTSNGQTVALSNGSFCTAISASDGSSIEGESFKFIICEECQDISNYKIRKSIHPMGAAYNATICKIGTATTFKGDFYEAINRNKEDFKKKKTGIRNHFEYDYKVVQRYNPKYAKYIEREKRSLGETSDEFQMSYCVTGDTKILTSDLRWVRADSIRKYDKLVGFDENSPKRYGQRRFKEAIVEDVGRIIRPCYEVKLSDGTKVKCSEEHQWLVFTAGSRTVWKQTKNLVSTDRIYKVFNVWDDLPKDYRLGYLSASFDGEGCISQVNGKIQQLTFAQRDNAMLSSVKQYLTDFGFEYNANYLDKRKKEMGHEDVYKLFIKGGKRELIRFLGSVRPKRLLNNFNANELGTVRCFNGKAGSEIHPYVNSLTYIGEQEVIPIRTSTRTYVAEGLASHNCLKWVISRGMFVDINKFEAECGDNYLDRVYQDHTATHVVGIDIGGGSSKNRKEADSTVITVVEVDWENPVLMESTIDEETGEPIVYMAYNTYIKDWYEIAPEIAENYEEQYHLIMDYLKNFKVARLVIDATREASLGQRIMANVNYDVVLFTFSSKSKSDIYKHLQTEINTGRARFPNNPKTRDTKEYKKYLAQMGDLQKSYSGSYLVVSHPDSRTAHDDYPDSWALAVWGTKDVGQVDNTETQNRDSVLRSHRETSMLFRSRNHYTARRR